MNSNLLSRIHSKIYKRFIKTRKYQGIFVPIVHYKNILNINKSIPYRLSFSNSSNTSDIPLGCPLLLNIFATIGTIYTLNEYIMEFIKCQGASMMPTIYPVGDIILIERITAHIYGLDGGDSGDDRWKAGSIRQKSPQIEVLNREKQLTSTNIIAKEKEKIPSYKSKSTSINEFAITMIQKLNRLYCKFTSGVHVGDVVVIEHPSYPGTICKRVLGLPGDIVVQPRQPFLNERIFSDLEFYGENENKVLKDNRFSSNLIMIPDAHIWVEGDNTLNSTDSRNYGPLPASLIVGKVICRVWPFRGITLIERKERPMPLNGELFSGSIVLPAGFDEQVISTHVKS